VSWFAAAGAPGGFLFIWPSSYRDPSKLTTETAPHPPASGAPTLLGRK